MKEKKDWGSFLAIVCIILCALIIFGIVVYQIVKDNKTCYDFSVRYSDGSISEYHCCFYYDRGDFFELHLHDGTIFALVKSNLSYVFINEVID